ncbi:MAG: nuclear transport factor 2 family protein [Pseudomonadota bacterium]|nr:nuclear transport factor 2 family protein [Pseudomonadota bacterium]
MFKLLQMLPKGAALSLLLIVCNPVIAAQVEEAVEQSVSRYFDGMRKHDFASMRALTTDQFEVISGGARLSAVELESFLSAGAKSGSSFAGLQPTQFNTQVTGDAAYTTLICKLASGSQLASVVLARTGGQWRIDRLVLTPVTRTPADVARQYYHYIKAYDFAGMRGLAAPDFQITLTGVRLSADEFEARQADEVKRVGAAKTRPSRFLYELSNFNTELSGDNEALVTFAATSPERPDAENIRNVYAEYWIVMRRADVHADWKLSKMISIRRLPLKRRAGCQLSDADLLSGRFGGC